MRRWLYGCHFSLLRHHSSQQQKSQPSIPELVVQVPVSQAERDALGIKVEDGVDPLAHRLHNIPSQDNPYQVTWFDYPMHPAKRFAFWAFRRIRQLPPDWRTYYRRYLRQEMNASVLMNTPWDAFMGVVNGYSKGKWILHKYSIPIDELLIPHPYNNFWENTTYEERAWAFRRSGMMKDLQGLQRQDDDVNTFGFLEGEVANFTLSVGNGINGYLAKDQCGTPVHSRDMSSPRESQVRNTSTSIHMCEVHLANIPDDQLMNPALRARMRRHQDMQEQHLLGFEDEDGDEPSN